MAEMSMNKVIHSAFRRDLTRFIDALTAFSPGDRARARQLGTAWENFDDQLTYHHEGEHEIAWPALAAVGVSPDLLIQMDSEHEVMASALAGARKSLTALQTTPTAEAASAALDAFKTLQSATVEHLDHEEAELEPVYLANREHPAITEMGKKFGKVSPVRGRPVLRLADRWRRSRGYGRSYVDCPRTGHQGYERHLRPRLPQERRPRLEVIRRARLVRRTR